MIGSLVHTVLGLSSLVANVLSYPPPLHANSFVLGPAVINKHTHKEELRETVFSVLLKQTRGEDWHERASVPAQGTCAETRCLLTHPPDAISISSALKELYSGGYICVGECEWPIDRQNTQEVRIEVSTRKVYRKKVET